MSTENVSNYYMGSFIGSLIGGIMIILFDFAAWDSSNYYLGIYSAGWFGTDSVGGLFILGPIGIALLYVAYHSYQGTKEAPPYETLELVYKVSRGALIAIVSVAIIFIITISGEDVYWWFDAGFYGGIIGSTISFLTIRLARESAVK